METLRKSIVAKDYKILKLIKITSRNSNVYNRNIIHPNLNVLKMFNLIA